jgi:choice-of-anchor A domain-containing protein
MALAAAALAAVSDAQGAVGPITGTSPLVPPLGACRGPQCPATWPAPHNGDFAGRDAAINVFTGADFLVSGQAADAEGKVVVLKDFVEDKNGGGPFDTGVAGAGSGTPPPDGDDFVTVGGNVDITTANQLEIGRRDSTTTASGNLRYAGNLTGQVDVAAPGGTTSDAQAAARYASLREYIEDRSACAATATATGTVTVDGPRATFRGDGSSMLQVFTVPGDIGGAGGVDLVFTRIPAGAGVLVNMTGDTPTINASATATGNGTGTGTGTANASPSASASASAGNGIAGDQLTGLRPRLMWNFPNAIRAEIEGGAQFQGSILAGNPDGTLTISTPGQNGRVYVAGNLVLTGSAAGAELHAYPFDGVLPECGSQPNPGTTASWTTPTTSLSERPSVFPSVRSHGLAATGGGFAPLFGLAALALAAGGAVLAFTARRKGTHV